MGKNVDGYGQKTKNRRTNTTTMDLTTRSTIGESAPGNSTLTDVKYSTPQYRYSIVIDISHVMCMVSVS